MNARRHSMLTLVALLVGAKSGPSSASSKANGQPMDEKKFWGLVEMSKTASGADIERRPAALETVLSTLPLESIQSFHRRYEQLLLKSNRWSLWGAAHIMNGGCSDDGFKYFRDWLISEGRTLFERALEDPDSLSDVARREYFELESFGYAASSAFKKMGGGELERDFQVELAQPTGNEWNEADLPKLFPKLSAKYMR